VRDDRSSADRGRGQAKFVAGTECGEWLDLAWLGFSPQRFPQSVHPSPTFDCHIAFPTTTTTIGSQMAYVSQRGGISAGSGIPSEGLT
jgi:hypothetical protein